MKHERFTTIPTGYDRGTISGPLSREARKLPEITRDRLGVWSWYVKAKDGVQKASGTASSRREACNARAIARAAR